MTTRRRLIFLCGGGDWADASADLLASPPGRNIEEDIAAYPGYEAAGCLSLPDWLRTLGYADPADHEAITVYG